MRPLERHRNIGISAHIDSGKTTLTERILYFTNRIHAIHEVRGKDGVGATMDSMELERERGITIQSAATYATWKDTTLNILDTPGHVDFTVEVERSLRVLDGAILVLCGVAGVQSQSITVDRQMRRYNVPRLAFVNKCDRSGANPFRVCDQLREKLKLNSVMMVIPIGLEDKIKGVVDLVRMRAVYFEGERGKIVREDDIPAELMDQAKEYREKLLDNISQYSEEMTDLLLEEKEIPEELIKKTVREATISLQLCPVYCGSAYKDVGVQVLLDAVGDYLPSPYDVTNTALDLDNNEAKIELIPEDDKPLVAYAFKLEDGRFGQLSYIRVYQGTLKKGMTIYNMSTKKKHTVGRLCRMHADNMEEIEQSRSGDIVALFGIDCASGTTFTDGKLNVNMTSMFVPNPVIELVIEAKNRDQLSNLSKGLNRFTKEDPTFRVEVDKESGQTIIKGMGELHLDVYIERLRREYGVDLQTGNPQVAYRETITKASKFDYTHKKQTGGSGQYAKVQGMIEPLVQAEGEEQKNYEFVSEIVGGAISKDFIPACDKGFQSSMENGGLIGFPIVNVRVRLQDGQMHEVDSSDMAFMIASRMAFRQAYANAGATILEPVMKVEVETPAEFQGAVLGNLNQRRGMIQGSSENNGYAVLIAEVPLSEMFGYATELRSMTQGKAEFTMEFARYGEVPKGIQKELMAKYSDRAKGGAAE